MAGLKGGSIIHAGNGQTVIDRIQSAGPGQVNIPTEKIYELGNYKSVATTRDTPDLSFSYNSYDVSTECEAFLSGQYAGRSVTDGVTASASPSLTSATAAFTADDVGRMVIVAGAGVDGGELVTTILSRTSGTVAVMADSSAVTIAAGAGIRIVTNGFDLSKSVPVDIASQFKAGREAADPFNVVASVALPFLYLESMSYKFGMHDNATQAASIKGDTIFYNPGPCYVETSAGTGVAAQVVETVNPAYQSAEGDFRRVLSVTVGTERLTFGSDYIETYDTETAGAAITTITLVAAVPTTSSVRIIYSSPTPLSYPQSVHATAAVKPAAVKGRDIEVYLGGYDPTDRPGSQAHRLPGVQSLGIDYKVTLDKDEEFGNHYAVGQDFDVPTVSGTLDFKPRSSSDLLVHLRQIAGISDANKMIGASTSVPLPLDVVILHPETGKPIKRYSVDDARFTIPGYTGNVQQKLVVTVAFDSDEGDLLVFER